MGHDDPPPTAPRAHGCQLPLNGYQIGASLVFLLLTASHYLASLPLLPVPTQLPLAVVDALATLLVVASFLAASLIDPTDPGLDLEADGNDGTALVCRTCDKYVTARSKHCRACRRCVDMFDHHCNWLNNCVGRRNYRAFLVLLASISFLTTYRTVTSVWAGIVGVVDPTAS